MESREIRSLADLRAVAKARRRELGLSQAQAAKAAGVSRQFVSGFERGQGGDLSTTLRLLAALDVTMLAIPGSPQDPATGPVIHQMHITDRMGVIDHLKVDLDEHLSTFEGWGSGTGSTELEDGRA